MTARQTRRRYRRRHRRLRALVAEHGMATYCSLPPGPALPRWALLEIGPAGQAWWNLGRDWPTLLKESVAALYASDWPATRLFDLDTSFSTAIELGPRLVNTPPTHTPRSRRRGPRSARRR